MTLPPEIAALPTKDRDIDSDVQVDEQINAQNDPQIDVQLPPTDLWSDEPPLESHLHLIQIQLLLDCLNWWWRDRDDYFASGNLTIYYDEKQITTRNFRGPDFFVVLGTTNQPRRSWMVWAEDGKYPNLIIEILSKSTASRDRTAKKQLYQDIFRTPDYFWFDPETLEFAGFHLVDGQYQPLPTNERGWMWSQQLELFLGISDRQLRFFSADGELIPTGREAALQSAERANRLAAKLRELGVDPDSF